MTTISRRLTLVQIVLGIWLIIMPYIFGTQLSSLLNSLAVGTIIGALSIYNLMFLEQTHREINVKISNFILLLGLWLMISPLLLTPQFPIIYNNLIVGIVVITTSSYNRFIRKKMNERTGDKYPNPA